MTAGMRTEDDKGFTLIELLIVISIIGILVVALGFSYVGWMGSYKVESATKGIYSDMMDARARAMQMNRSYFLNFPTATSYRIVEDTNENNGMDVGAGDTVLPTFPKTVGYTLSITGPPAPPAATFTFDKRGIISPTGTVRLISTSNPDYDCITIADIRIIMGHWNGTACVEK